MAYYIMMKKKGQWFYHSTGSGLGSIESAWKLADRMYGPKGSRPEFEVVGLMDVDKATSTGFVGTRPQFDQWCEAHQHEFITRNPADTKSAPITPGPRRPPRQCIPEVERQAFVAMEDRHGEMRDVLVNTTKVDPDELMKAVRAACKAGGSLRMDD